MEEKKKKRRIGWKYFYVGIVLLIWAYCMNTSNEVGRDIRDFTELFGILLFFTGVQMLGWNIKMSWPRLPAVGHDIKLIKSFIRNKWFKLIIILLIGAGLCYLAFQFYTQVIEPQQQINNFVNNLPIGDVDSQSCNQLIDTENINIDTDNNASQSMSEVATNPQDKLGFSEESEYLENSSYLYSHKLCLAEISMSTYYPTFGFATSSGMTYTTEIVDLATNNILAEEDDMPSHNEIQYYLRGQQQPNITSKPDDIDANNINAIWSVIEKSN